MIRTFRRDDYDAGIPAHAGRALHPATRLNRPGFSPDSAEPDGTGIVHHLTGMVE
jgi:hypothetical protein